MLNNCFIVTSYYFSILSKLIYWILVNLKVCAVGWVLILVIYRNSIWMYLQSILDSYLRIQGFIDILHYPSFDFKNGLFLRIQSHFRYFRQLCCSLNPRASRILRLENKASCSANSRITGTLGKNFLANSLLGIMAPL